MSTTTESTNACIVCGKEATRLFRCSRCRDPTYLLCSTDCQREDWKRHKTVCHSLRMELLGTGQEGIIPLLVEKPQDALVTRIKSEPPPSELVQKARETFESKADQIFIDEVARFARVCQVVLQENGGDRKALKILIAVGTKPNATLDPAVLNCLQAQNNAMVQGAVTFYIHRLGTRERFVDESVVVVERVIQFIQQATNKDKEGDKLKVILISYGGHDSDCVVKKILDKPNSMRDLLAGKSYSLLNGSAVAGCSLPWAIMGREGFYCVACERRSYFCGLGEPSEREELIRNEGEVHW